MHKLYLDNPLNMLTQRALDRRTNQNIALNLTDVPVEVILYQSGKSKFRN